MVSISDDFCHFFQILLDNLNGVKVAGRIIKVDHVLDFKPPKDSSSESEEEQLGMAKTYRRKKRGYEKKKKRKRYGDPDDPDFDHEMRKIRKGGVAPVREKGRQDSDSDDGLLPYHGERFRKSDFQPKEAESSSSSKKKKSKKEKRSRTDEEKYRDRYQD